MSLFKLYKRLRWRDWIYLIIIIGLTVFQVWATMENTDAISSMTSSIQQGDKDGIWHNALLMLLYVGIIILTQVVIAIFASAITAAFAVKVRDEMHNKITSFSLAEINQFSTASLITRTSNDVEQVQMTTLFTIRMLFAAPITAIWAIVKIRASSMELTIATAIAVVVVVISLIAMMLLVFPKFKIIQQKIDRLNLVTRETLNGVRVVRAYNGEEYQKDKFVKSNLELTNLSLFAGRVTGLFNPVVSLVMDSLSLAMIWIGATLVDKLSGIARVRMYGTIMSFMMLSTQIIMSFMMLLMLFIIWPRAVVSAKRIVEVLDTKPSIVDIENPEEFKEKGTIVFDDVSFKYPKSENNVIEHVSFEAKEGDVVAIIGATGSGKTTLVNLIDRVYDVSEGKVMVNGVDVKNASSKDLRSHIRFVPQKGLLFAGTVASNIKYGAPNLSEEEMKNVASISCADSFIEEMENKYEAPISQGGNNVSGGQRQRLCIARACALNPDIFIFDDSFSALDFKTDRQVRLNLKQAYPKATKIIVAQRVGTIMEADLILVLENGRIVGKGKHKELLNSCDVYKEIALSQLSKEELGL